MATYKVPQDVEADDKLIGPFSFRQFIYLIIVAMSIALAWGLAQLFVGLAVIPVPIIIFFGALALPLRKDQPMEIYMAAIVSFYLKPRQRLWDPDGVESLIEVTAPKTVDIQRTKDLSQYEAQERLSYLANIVDSQGWAIRGVSGAAGTAMNSDIYLEAQSAEDVLDSDTPMAHTFEQMMSQSSQRVREEARQRMFQTSIAAEAPQQPVVAAPEQSNAYAYAQPAPAIPPVFTQAPQEAMYAQPMPQPVATAEPTAAPHFDPYPSSIHQSVIQPINDLAHEAENTTSATSEPVAEPKAEEKPPTTSSSVPTADIINLANNTDLSIETIAHEANRLKKKAKDESDEVIISLR